MSKTKKLKRLEVETVYQPGVIAVIEQFTLASEELRQYVVYTYYDEDETPLYIGYSKNFYNAHYFNRLRLAFFDKVKYVGFCFFEKEEYMKPMKEYYIRIRGPLYTRLQPDEPKNLDHEAWDPDDLVVLEEEMTRRWAEWLS